MPLHVNSYQRQSLYHIKRLSGVHKNLSIFLFSVIYNSMESINVDEVIEPQIKLKQFGFVQSIELRLH